MSLSWIRQNVAKLQKRYRNMDAMEICEAKDIIVNYAPFGNGEDDLKGFCICHSRCAAICINSDIDDRSQEIILTHELMHIVLHQVSSDTSLLDRTLFSIVSQNEYDANMAVADFMLPDEEILPMLQRGADFYRLAKKLRVPPELLDFKYRILRSEGYDIQPPLYASSDFMKKVGNNTHSDTFDYS